MVCFCIARFKSIALMKNFPVDPLFTLLDKTHNWKQVNAMLCNNMTLRYGRNYKKRNEGNVICLESCSGQAVCHIVAPVIWI